jgi:hypothetical protein
MDLLITLIWYQSGKGLVPKEDSITDYGRGLVPKEDSITDYGKGLVPKEDSITDYGKGSSQKKSFDLGAILNISTGRLYTNMNDIYDVLNYLTGDNLFTHQLPRVMEFAQDYILALYPELKGVGVDTPISNIEEATAFVNIQKQKFGDKLPLTPMTKESGYISVDPLTEFNQTVSSKHM